MCHEAKQIFKEALQKKPLLQAPPATNLKAATKVTTGNTKAKVNGIQDFYNDLGAAKKPRIR